MTPDKFPRRNCADFHLSTDQFRRIDVYCALRGIALSRLFIERTDP
jgi:hypothetical protein